MPQLWTETIVTQYFWLVLILLGFYYIAVTKIIPQIAFTLKARRFYEASSEEDAPPLSGAPSGPKGGLDNGRLTPAPRQGSLPSVDAAAFLISKAARWGSHDVASRRQDGSKTEGSFIRAGSSAAVSRTLLGIRSLWISSILPKVSLREAGASKSPKSSL